MNDLFEMKTTLDVLACMEESPKSCSRADIAKYLDLSRTTVSTAVARLIQLGLVQEDASLLYESPIHERGRPGVPLKLRTDKWYAIGASFHTSTWFFVLTDLACNVVHSFSLKLTNMSKDTFLQVLIEGLNQMIDYCPGHLLPLLGVGIPGLVDDRTGVILHAEDLGWHNIPLGETVLQHTGIPVAVLNRHRACALAEAKLGSHLKTDSLVYLGIDTGIIATIFLNGSLLTGVINSAGEIGHTIIDPNGRICKCGKRGCLQAMASLGAINSIIDEAYCEGSPHPERDVFLPYLQEKSLIPGEVIMDAACSDHPIALNALREISKYLGLAIGNFINLLNPQIVILGGPLVYSHNELLTKLITDEASKYALDYTFGAVHIVPSRLGIYSGAIGAAALALERKLELVLKSTDSSIAPKKCKTPL